MSERSSKKRYPVLIAGAGPVGLSLAIETAYRGVRCLLVEQSDGSVDFPTTNLASTRTVEHLRRWGIADRMRFQSGYPTDYPRNYLFVTRMDGYEIARFEHPSNGDPASRSPYSPEGRLWISKPYFDPVLHRHVETLPTVEVRYETSLESFEPSRDVVVARIAGTTTGIDVIAGKHPGDARPCMRGEKIRSSLVSRHPANKERVVESAGSKTYAGRPAPANRPARRSGDPFE